MRGAQSQAKTTFNNATDAAAGYGAAGDTINSQLTPFLTQRLQHPEGYSQGDLTSMLSAALGSQGGSTSAITGQAEQNAARTRNDAGFSSALTQAAREKAKNLAATSEGVSATNAGLKQDQQNNAAKMLSGLYGTDVGAASDFTKNANDATQTGIEAGKSGWFQNMTQLLASINGAGAKGVAL